MACHTRVNAVWASVVCASLWLCAAVVAQNARTVLADVYSDPKKPPITVNELHIKLEPSGLGWYNRSEYPEGAFVPLETGERVPFSKLSELVLARRQVELDQADGKKRKVDVVESTLTLATGEKVEGRLMTPGTLVTLTGKTSLGDFTRTVKSDQVRIVFRVQ
jgi:hypothetical protein